MRRVLSGPARLRVGSAALGMGLVLGLLVPGHDAVPTAAAQMLDPVTSGEFGKNKSAKRALRAAAQRYRAAEKSDQESQRKLAALSDKVERARKRAKVRHRELGILVREAYTSGNADLNFLAYLVEAPSSDDLFDRITTTERLVSGKEVQVQRAHAAEDKVERLREKARVLRSEAKQELSTAKAELAATRAVALNRMGAGAASALPDMSGGGAWVFPVPGASIGSNAGMRLHPILGYVRCHAGADIRAYTGSPIVAVANGVVVQTGPSGGYGNYTQITHGSGVTSGYAHQNSIIVSPGQRVTRGDVIGTVGSTGLSTGPHLHFEARVDGNPYNPQGWFLDRADLRHPAC